MPQAVMQYSFAAGEWAPALNARVDLAKYSTACAFALNFFVDYRGGLSSRPGTKYILKAYNSAQPVRLITFQASFTVGYVLEFGELYVRFINNGSYILETAKVITGATKANPGVITSVAHGFSVGNWVYIQDVGGMTELNNRYFIINTVPTADTFTLKDLFNVAVNTTSFGTYTSGGTAKRVYTVASPYSASDLALLKFAQDVNTMVFTHPDYAPYLLTLISAANWTLLPITFGTNIAIPSNVAAVSTLGAGTVNYSYVVTAHDVNGQESGASTAATLANLTDIRTNPGTNRITWNSVTGAASYSIYKAELSYTNVVPAGATHGFIGNCTGVAFDDSNIDPDFSLTPPVPQNPFTGASVASITVTTEGTYAVCPTANLTASPTAGGTARVQPILQVKSSTNVGGGGGGSGTFVVGDYVDFPNGVRMIVATVSGGGPTSFQPVTFPGTNRGAISAGAVPANPVSGSGPNGGPGSCFCDFTWGVGIVQILAPGTGYAATPTVTFVGAFVVEAVAVAVLGDTAAGNPSVPGYFQQRLVLGAQERNPQSAIFSQPAASFNFNTSNPAQEDDAITATLKSGRLNTIKAFIPQSGGLIVLTDGPTFLMNGGSLGSPITPASATANAQSYIGANDVPPIVANDDILYVQAKGSSVRNAQYSFERNVVTGTDISVLSSHLFQNYQINEWAWAEEPYKVVWAVRNDGILLSCTFVKEQALIGWCHSDTDGEFKSVASVTEQVANDIGNTYVDAVYVVVERSINGQDVKYIERLAERNWDEAFECWCVDAGLRYDGAATTTITGGYHLAGETCTGLADGLPITPFVMPANGTFTLPTAASTVIFGKAFTPQFQSLSIDLGEPTVQGKMKKLPSIILRVKDTLGLTIGSDFDHQVPIKDLVLGNVSSMLSGQTNQTVTNLVSGDVQGIPDSAYTAPGQFCVEQPEPYPVTLLGVIPDVIVGDTTKKARA